MNRLRIFVDFAVTPAILDLLQEGTQGHQLVFPKVPVASVLAKAEPDPQLATADIAFGQPDPQALREAGSLQWVHISSSSITRYDQAEFRAEMARRGIAVTNSAGVYADACAAHALSFLLAQARNLPRALKSRAPGGSPEWHELRGTSIPLQGATILIAGFGAIGRRLVEMLRPFEVKVLAYRRKARGAEGVPVLGPEELPQALGRADHVINILPDSAETRHFFDRARFAQLKPGAVFYNIGRGATVDQEALQEALRAGRLKAAWLDVTEPEPLPDSHPLWREPNCFITPHIAGGHQDETKTLVRHFLRNFARFTHGEPLEDRVM